MFPYFLTLTLKYYVHFYLEQDITGQNLVQDRSKVENNNLRLNHWVIDGDEFKRRFWEDRHYNPPVRKDIFFLFFSLSKWGRNKGFF